MAEWLESSTVTAVLGSKMSEQVDTTVLDAVVPGIRSWVEGKRSDLVTGDPPAFTPTPDVILGAALLAWRIYDRRRSPVGVVGASDDGYAGIIRDDPDIARLLGIGSAGKFVFGAHNPDADAEAV